MRAIRQMAGAMVIFAFVLAALLALIAALRLEPQDLPWTPIDPGQPIGAATGRKLTALTGDVGACHALLDRAGARYRLVPPVTTRNCGYADGVRLLSGGARRIALMPRDVDMACPVAAALAIWEWQVVQPAARRAFASAVVGIDHLGSYNCRRLYGRVEGAMSEHASADAIDIAGFRLANGARVTVLRDWQGNDAKARFLREVRDGACRLFATTLSPDYNAAHRDHFHLDQAARGTMGWRACR